MEPKEPLERVCAKVREETDESFIGGARERPGYAQVAAEQVR
jgi:hypothetical protein